MQAQRNDGKLHRRFEIQGSEQGDRQVDLSSTWVEINDVCVSRIQDCVYSTSSRTSYILRKEYQGRTSYSGKGNLTQAER